MAGAQTKLNYHSALLLKTAVDSGITSPAELANIMGNAHVETGGFTRMHENFRYRSASAVVAAVSSADDRFTWKQVEDAVASKDPQRPGVAALPSPTTWQRGCCAVSCAARMCPSGRTW